MRYPKPPPRFDPALHAQREASIKRVHKLWWHPLVQIWPIAPALIALFAPNDVLDRWSWAKDFCAQMIQWFPFLEAHGWKSRFAQVTTLTKCVSWAMILPSALVASGFWWHKRRIYLETILNGAAAPVQWWFYPIMLLMASIFIVGGWLIPGDPSFAKGFTTTNRFGLALIDYIAVFAIGASISLSMVSIYIHLQRNKTH